MRVPVKLAVFAAVLLVALGAAFAIGKLSGVDGQEAAADPGGDQPGQPMDSHGADDADGGHAADGTGDDRQDGAHAGPLEPGGLQVTADGYTFDLLSHPVSPGEESTFEFRIVGPDGAPVTEFTSEHDADLHLIVVNRDLSDYQHVHPELAADGTWSVPLTLDGAGVYRAFADFTPANLAAGLTLGTDVLVAGEYEPRPLPEPALAAEVDGYTVEAAGRLVPGSASPLTLTVRRAGEPITDLQPYLGAYGHLVALRERDLAYLHVHPDDATAAPGPDVGFVAEVPSAGTYRLYFEFQHDGTVHRAEFTAETSDEH